MLNVPLITYTLSTAGICHRDTNFYDFLQPPSAREQIRDQIVAFFHGVIKPKFPGENCKLPACASVSPLGILNLPYVRKHLVNSKLSLTPDFDRFRCRRLVLDARRVPALYYRLQCLYGGHRLAAVLLVTPELDLNLANVCATSARDSRCVQRGTGVTSNASVLTQPIPEGDGADERGSECG